MRSCYFRRSVVERSRNFVNRSRFCKCNSETCQPGKLYIGNDDTDDGDDDVLEDDDDNCDVMMLVMIMLTMAIMMFWKLTIVMMIISTTTPFAVELTLLLVPLSWRQTSDPISSAIVGQTSSHSTY